MSYFNRKEMTTTAAPLNLQTRYSRDKITSKDLREKTIVRLLAEGKISKEIAALSNVSRGYLEKIIQQIMDNHNCRTRPQLVAKFIREGKIK